MTISQYVKPFLSDTGTLRTDRRTDVRTDRQTELLDVNIARISRVSVLTRDNDTTYNYANNG